MQSNSLSVSELGNANDRNRNTMRGTQPPQGTPSWSADPFGNSWGGNGMSNAQPQYLPGYLLSATQGRSMLGTPSSFQPTPLIPEPYKRSTSNLTFGAESLLSSPSKPTLRMTKSAPEFDDENAPPTMSLMDSAPIVQEKLGSSSLMASSTSGFYPATPIQSPQAASSSSSTSYAVIVFGFPPDQATAVAQLFSSMGDVASLEPPPQGANWFQISYQNSWEAARAVRKSGEILGDHIMIGVRWADASQGEVSSLGPSSASAIEDPGTPNLIHQRSNSQPGPSFGIGRPMALAPSSAAFKQQGAQNQSNGSSWGLAAHQKAMAEGRPVSQQEPGILGKISDLVFGW